MSLFGINTTELLIVMVVVMLVVGPDRLPEYVAKLRGWIQQARRMAEGAKSQLKAEAGPEFQDIDWRQYDPRQYDPRAIVRQALFDDPAEQTSTGSHAATEEDFAQDAEPAQPAFSPQRYDPDRPTPWDLDAT